MPRMTVDTPLKGSSAMQELIEQRERARCLAMPLSPPESYQPLKGLIHHYEDVEPSDYQYAAQGLHVTKFGRGFRRKIVPPPVDPQERDRQQWERERRAEEHAAQRREFLRRQQQRNGVQVITAEPLEGYHHKEYHQRAHTGEPSAETKREAETKFRTSEFRYYASPRSREAIQDRQALMLREGLNTAKKTSLLGVGRNNLPSYGVEDQFSKSEYFPRSKPCTGLVETRQFVTSTPRQRLNPPATARSTNRQLEADIALVRALA